ncbi:MAG: M28 family metallopeptidase, partial [Polymorphobacter sp.]
MLAATAVTAAPAPVFSPRVIEANASYLADDLLEGRETGTRGHEIAARYVASQFASYGLQPGGKDGSWFQRVTLQEARLTDTVPARVTISGAGTSQSWANGTDVILGPSQLRPVTNVEAPVVFVGFGLDAPAQGFDDYAGLDVRGKIVAVLSGIPKGPPDEIWAHLATQTGRMAAARGAIGMVSIPTIESAALHPWA